MNVEQARFNMIEQQIRPWDVLDARVLELLAVVRREDFVPPAHRALAFADLTSLRVAVDQELADFSAPLAGVREVAFFPPMTGG